uniref:pyridoxamine 5'-phosphate oxidase family protein n=1 Tax=Streptomyces rimosus TaxID=1927 RepID=UPI001F2B33D9|nr:hypothetical protein [Streptomyces rimosus]
MPVGVTVDAVAGVARVITRKYSRKVANVLAGGSEARVAVCQVDGGRWAALEGVAEVCTDEATVEDVVARYGQRYGRTPAPDPERVALLISIDRSTGQTLGARPRPPPPQRRARRPGKRGSACILALRGHDSRYALLEAPRRIEPDRERCRDTVPLSGSHSVLTSNRRADGGGRLLR